MTKLDVLKSYGDLNYSKSGSVYVVLSESVSKKYITKSWANVTKNKVLVDEEKQKSYFHTLKEILLLSNNKFFYKMQMDVFFKPLGISHVKTHSRLANAFFFNKKCEFLKNEDASYFPAYSFLKSFTSLKEVKNFLGFTFLSVEKFKTYKFQLILTLYMRFKDAKIVYRFLKNDSEEWISYLEDIENMDKLPITIPDSPAACIKLHEELVYKNNLANIESKSTKIVTFEHPFDNVTDFEEKKRLISEKDLFIEGLEMHHCVGSRSYLLDSNAFYSIKFESKKYTLQLNKTGKLVEIQGYKNRLDIPEKLKQIIQLN